MLWLNGPMWLDSRSSKNNKTTPFRHHTGLAKGSEEISFLGPRKYRLAYPDLCEIGCSRDPMSMHWLGNSCQQGILKCLSTMGSTQHNAYVVNSCNISPCIPEAVGNMHMPCFEYAGDTRCASWTLSIMDKVCWNPSEHRSANKEVYRYLVC